MRLICMPAGRSTSALIASTWAVMPRLMSMTLEPASRRTDIPSTGLPSEYDRRLNSK